MKTDKKKEVVRQQYQTPLSVDDVAVAVVFHDSTPPKVPENLNRKVSSFVITSPDKRAAREKEDALKLDLEAYFETELQGFDIDTIAKEEEFPSVRNSYQA